jgi:hypothetical protein
MATVANVATTFDADGVLHGAGEAARRRFFDDVATLTAAARGGPPGPSVP